MLTNNLKDLRGRTSQRELAEIAGMTPLAIHRFEETFYQVPSTMYVNALSEVSGYPPKDIADTYRRQRDDTIAYNQDRARHFLKDSLWVETMIDSAVSRGHPFQEFVGDILRSVGENPSDINWCRFSCFHPAQYDRFLRAAKSIPGQQRQFLLSAGMKNEHIVTLNAAIKEYQGG